MEGAALETALLPTGQLGEHYSLLQRCSLQHHKPGPHRYEATLCHSITLSWTKRSFWTPTSCATRLSRLTVATRRFSGNSSCTTHDDNIRHANNKKGSWFLKYQEEMNPELVSSVWFVCRKIRTIKKRMALSTAETMRLAGELAQWRSVLNNMRRDCLLYVEFSTLENIDLLGEDFIRRMKRELRHRLQYCHPEQEDTRCQGRLLWCARRGHQPLYSP